MPLFLVILVLVFLPFIQFGFLFSLCYWNKAMFKEPCYIVSILIDGEKTNIVNDKKE